MIGGGSETSIRDEYTRGVELHPIRDEYSRAHLRVGQVFYRIYGAVSYS